MSIPISGYSGGTPGFVGNTAPSLFGFMLQLYPWMSSAPGFQQSPPSGLLYGMLVGIVNNLGIVGDQVIDTSNPTATYSVTFPDGSTQTYVLGSLLHQMLRIRTMGGPVLDIAVADFYGENLPRLTNESDTSYYNRFLSGLIVRRVTRPAIFAMLQSLTGVNPRMIDFWRPSDVGGLSSTTGAIGTLGGESVYLLAANMPPCFLNTDTGGAPGRLSNPGGLSNAIVNPGGTPNPWPAQGGTLPSAGYAYQGLIDTTWPLGFGAQGNPAEGCMTVTGSYPPTETGGTLVVGSPSVYNNLSGASLVSTGAISVVAGRSYYLVTNGNPSYAMFNPTGLTPSDMANGQAQVLLQIDKFKADGITIWARCVPAAALFAQGWTS